MAGKAKALRGRGHARQLDRDRILATAQALARADGPGGVTMRAIARALDVDVAALYWHFDSKAALLDALSDFAAEEPLPAATGKRWQERTLDVCRAIRARLRDQPELRLAGSRAFAPFTTRSVAALCRALDGCGLANEATLFAAQTLVQTVLAVVATEIAQAGSAPEAARDYVRDQIQGLPGPLADTWLRLARQDPRDTFATFFEEAVGFVVAGIEARGSRSAG